MTARPHSAGTIPRALWSILRRRPLVVIGLVVILVLGGREITGANGGRLTAEDQRILHHLTVSARGTATALVVTHATDLVILPVIDQQLSRDAETAPAPYPEGAWTIGWASNCGTIAKPHSSIDLYSNADASYLHGTNVARATTGQRAGWTYEDTHRNGDQQFVIIAQGPCTWHIRVMRGHRQFPVSKPISGPQ